MSIRRLAILQWLGFLGGGVVWWMEFLAGIGASQAVCNPGSGRWGIPHDAVQAALMAFGLVCVLGAQAAAVVVFRATRDVGDEDPPPEGRIHFFATAALLANTAFLVIILLTGVATIADRTCHQA
jgi:hypothetical protein